MKTNVTGAVQGAGDAAKSLSAAIGQNEQVENLVGECAKELTSINVVMNEEFAVQAPPQAVANALEKSAAVEEKVQEVAEKLSVVNEALHEEVAERH